MKSNKRIHSKTIDAGSGYLCQMEPVAHYGIRQGEKDFKVEIKWTDGSIESFDIDELNKTYEFRQKLQDNTTHYIVLKNFKAFIYQTYDYLFFIIIGIIRFRNCNVSFQGTI